LRSTSILIIIGLVGIVILSINAIEVFSVDKSRIVSGFDDKNSAQSIFITINDANGQISFNTFSRIGILRSSNPAFLLESIPTTDNKEFLEFVSNSLNRGSNPTFFDVTIDILAQDGTIIETLRYTRCTIDSYFVYNNDSKGTFSLLDRDSAKSEIRDVTRFECTRLTTTV